MNLIDLIKDVDDWQNKTAAQIATVLNEPSVTKTRRDLISYAGLGEELTHPVAAAIQTGLKMYIESLKPPSEATYALYSFLDYANWALEQGNYDPGLPTTIAKLEEFRSVLEPLGVPVSAIKQIGQWSISPWQNAGYEGIATELAVRKELLIESARQELEVHRNAFEQYRADVAAWNGTGDPPAMGTT